MLLGCESKFTNAVILQNYYCFSDLNPLRKAEGVCFSEHNPLLLPLCKASNNDTHFRNVHFPISKTLFWGSASTTEANGCCAIQHHATVACSVSGIEDTKLVEIALLYLYFSFMSVKTGIISALHLMGMWQRLIRLWISKIIHTLTEDKIHFSSEKRPKNTGKKKCTLKFDVFRLMYKALTFYHLQYDTSTSINSLCWLRLALWIRTTVQMLYWLSNIKASDVCY